MDWPMTATDLLTVWRLRDIRYATRKRSLSEREIACILDWRRSEMAALSAVDQGKAGVALAAWAPRAYDR
jgi:hypothetical protein